MGKLVLASGLVALFMSMGGQAENIHFPEEIVPLQVGEKVIEQSFFSRIDDVELAPGVYQLKLKYTDLYEEGYDSHQVIDSEPFWVELTVESGTDYDLVFERASNVVAAKVFAESPQVSLKAKGSQLATPLKVISKRGQAAKQVVAANSNTTAATSGVAATAAITNSVNEASTLPAKTAAHPDTMETTPNAAAMLEFWWQQASAEQRQAFLNKVKK